MNRDDLTLQAYLYVHGELPSAECQAFELRLADDRAAREAVAKVVELTQAVAALPAEVWRETPVAARSVGMHWRRRLVWLASGTVACALLAVAFMRPADAPHGDRRADRDVNRPTVNQISGDLAMEWAATHASDDAEIDEVGSIGEMAQDSLFHLAHTSRDLVAGEEDAEIDWVQAAVAGLGMSGFESGPVMKE